MTQDGQERLVVRSYLDRLIRGAERPQDIFAEARETWLSGRWPGPSEDGFDPIAHDVLSLLADARQMGVSHEDAPALLAYLDPTDGDIETQRERLYEHVMSVDPAAREALQQSDHYYEARSPEREDDRWEIFLSNTEHRRLHRGVRLDPESVWPDLRALLCDPSDPFDYFRVDLVEDLIHQHAEAFIDRVEALVEECEPAAITVAWASVGGAAGAGIDRFDALQQRLLTRLAPDGTFRTARDIPER